MKICEISFENILKFIQNNYKNNFEDRVQLGRLLIEIFGKIKFQKQSKPFYKLKCKRSIEEQEPFLQNKKQKQMELEVSQIDKQFR